MTTKTLLNIVLVFLLVGCAAKKPLAPNHCPTDTWLGHLSCLDDQLEDFKVDPEFHRLGFDPGSPFERWMTEAQDMAANVNGPQDAQDAARALIMLGMACRQEQGRETALTQALSRQIQVSLMQLRMAKSEKSSSPADEKIDQVVESAEVSTQGQTEKTPSALPGVLYLLLDDKTGNAAQPEAQP